MSQHRAPYPTDLYRFCPCRGCLTAVAEEWKLSLCPACGDKRCPGGISHDQHEETR